MKKIAAIFLVAILAGSFIVPMAFSDDGKNADNDNNQENDKNNGNTTLNDNHENEKDNGKLQFGFSNSTSTKFTLPNGTEITFGFSNGTNVGQQISGFIHQIRDIFKQQENQSKQTIKDCRAKAREASSPADKKNIMNECKAKLKEINQQFQSDHKQLQVDFKQFRNMVVGNNQENHEKASMQNDTKIQNKTQTFGRQHGLEQSLNQHENHGKGHLQNHGKQD